MTADSLHSWSLRSLSAALVSGSDSGRSLRNASIESRSGCMSSPFWYEDRRRAMSSMPSRTAGSRSLRLTTVPRTPGLEPLVEVAVHPAAELVQPVGAGGRAGPRRDAERRHLVADGDHPLALPPALGHVVEQDVQAHDEHGPRDECQQPQGQPLRRTGTDSMNA